MGEAHRRNQPQDRSVDSPLSVKPATRMRHMATRVRDMATRVRDTPAYQPWARCVLRCGRRVAHSRSHGAVAMRWATLVTPSNRLGELRVVRPAHRGSMILPL